MLRYYWALAFLMAATAANADTNRVTLALISGGPTLAWHEAALAEGSPKPFGEGCVFDVDDGFVRALERVASAGVLAPLDPDAPFSVVEVAVFKDGTPVLIMGGSSDIRIPSQVAFRLDPAIYGALRSAVTERATQSGC